MVTVILMFNLLIALGCLYVAWRVWQLRRVLVRVTATLTIAERSTHRVLYGAPNKILRGQTGVYQLQQQYQQVALQLQKAQQILALLGMGQLVWQRYRRAPSARRAATAKRSHPKPLRNLYR
jgi:environmental stress-induced protein Ves